MAEVPIASPSALSIITKGTRAKWWVRRGSKKRGFWYEDSNHKKITKAGDLERIQALVIPPAWTSVRISPYATSKIQALGLDTAGRVQYLYHGKFVERQEKRKFQKLELFGEHLPALRRITNEHIGLEGFPKNKVLAIIIRLINDLYFRVGSESSVTRYRTYGVTTLRNRHLTIGKKGQLLFNFIGKHHIRHRKLIVDRDLASMMQELKAIRSSKLFNYIDEEGKVRPVKPADINNYIKAATSSDFSAKDFRTWGGTLLAAIALAEIGPADSAKSLKKNVVKAINKVAEHLGNTVSVCRSSYVHPKVIKKYESGITLEQFRKKVARYITKLQPEYEPEEAALLKLLRHEQ